MHILVTNDDGPPALTSSPYIHTLISHLKSRGYTVSVILPHIQRSWIGKAHFIGQTVSAWSYYPGPDPHKPGEGSSTSPHPPSQAPTSTTDIVSPTETPSSGQRPSNANDNSSEPWILVDGTPATCVQLGLHHFFTHKGPIDLVLSGPNYGRNTTTLFALSSGTLGGALEATTFEVKALAVSYAYFSPERNWNVIEAAGKVVGRLVNWFCEKGNWAEDVEVYSVNVPLVEGMENREVWVTKMLENKWRSGSGFVEVEEEENDKSEGKEAEERERKIREQKGEAGQVEGRVGGKGEGEGERLEKRGVRKFKWAPRFADVHRSVNESGPGQDGWCIKQGFTSITPLRASFTEAQTQHYGQLKITSPSMPESLNRSSMTTDPSPPEPSSSTSPSDLIQNLAPPSLRFYLHLPPISPYLHPFLLRAISSTFHPHSYCLLPSPPSPLYLHPQFTSYLQISPYESLDHSSLLTSPQTYFGNSYIYRKALIRKHFLAHTVRSWVVKHEDSVLANGVPESVGLEVDYAEFLEDAVMESENGWLLRESWARNEELENGNSNDGEDRKNGGREWWILKPGMGDQGNGIRVFSSEEELREIFEEWEEQEEEDREGEGEESSGEQAENIEQKKGEEVSRGTDETTAAESNNTKTSNNGVLASSLRHFICQPYIPPLLLPIHFIRQPISPHNPPALTKFHIRTYVLALGALKVYVYEHMLALFASEPYLSPSEIIEKGLDPNAELARRGLSNTCLQQKQVTPTQKPDSEEKSKTDDGLGALDSRRRTVQEVVHLLSNLPHHIPTRAGGIWSPSNSVTSIKALTKDLFLAASSQPAAFFQPLPNAFEVYGLDFLVDEAGKTWLLEVNAFPDFGMTGNELGEKVVGGLWRGVFREVGRGFFGEGVLHDKEGSRGRVGADDVEKGWKDGGRAEEEDGKEEGCIDVGGGMWRVLDLDLGMR